MKRRRSILKTVTAPIIVIVAFIPTLAIAIREVLAGRGAATYTNVYELPIHYTSVLITVAVLILVIAVAYVARIVYFWRFGYKFRLRTSMTPGRSLSLVIIWLTRIGGAIVSICGISFFVLAWAERSIAPVVMGVITVGLGLVVASIRCTPNGNIEYGLFRSRK
jgi:uncharacterized membrane protein YwaF